MTINNPNKVSVLTLKQHKPEQLLTFQLSVLSQILARVVEGAVSQDLNLSSRQWRVLVILNRLGPTTSGEVASATHLDHSQVSRASYELVDKGLICMRSDAADRRKQLLSITPQGIEILRMGILGSQKRQSRLQGAISAEDHQVFTQVIDAFMKEANQMLLETKGKK